jgi:hypothetical protein
MKITTNIATGLIFAPVASLLVACYSLARIFILLSGNLAADEKTTQIAAHIYLILLICNIAAIAFAIGARIHLSVSRSLGERRPWIWSQVFWCSFALVPQIPAIVPVGAIAILLGFRSKELKQLNTEPNL